MTIIHNTAQHRALFFLLLLLLLPAGLGRAEEAAIFTKQGTITRIDPLSIVIDDCSYIFTPASRFLGDNGAPTSPSAFAAQDFITYQATTKGEIVAIGVTSGLATPKAKTISPPTATPPEPTSPTGSKPAEIIFENGKWHN